MKIIVNFLIYLFIIVLSLNCERNKNPINSSAILLIKNDTLITTAQLYWAGEYEVDGCGYIIEIKEHKYKAINENVINDIYKTFYDTVQVKLEYINLNKKQSYHCGDLPYSIKYNVIDILSIERL